MVVRRVPKLVPVNRQRDITLAPAAPDRSGSAARRALVIAEGECCRQAVHRMGCDIGPGYFLARPMPKASAIALLEQRAPQKQGS